MECWKCVIKNVYSKKKKSEIFQASSHLLWLYSPVCVGPGRKTSQTDFLVTRLNYIFCFGTGLFTFCDLYDRINEGSDILAYLPFAASMTESMEGLIYSRLALNSSLISKPSIRSL